MYPHIAAEFYLEYNLGTVLIFTYVKTKSDLSINGLHVSTFDINSEKLISYSKSDYLNNKLINYYLYKIKSF